VHWGDERFLNRADRLPALHEWLDEGCREAGRDPSSIWRSAEVYMRFEGAQGLPIRVTDDLEPVTPDVDTLREFEEAGVDHLVVLVDPQTPAAVERLASLVAECR
jgi:hypothetical protein